MKFRVCSRCKFPVKQSDNPKYSYQCLHCDEDLLEFETEEHSTVKNQNPVVIGTKEDKGFVGFDFCDELCSHCMGECFNIPARNVSLCAHCGAEIFPCSACRDAEVACDYDLTKGGCHRFHYSDNHHAREMARMLKKEIQLFVGDDVHAQGETLSGRARIVGTAGDEYKNIPDSKPSDWEDCFMIDFGDSGTMTIHKSKLTPFYVYVENEGLPS